MMNSEKTGLSPVVLGGAFIVHWSVFESIILFMLKRSLMTTDTY